MRKYKTTLVGEALADYTAWVRMLDTPRLESKAEELQYQLHGLTAPGGKVDAYEKSRDLRIASEGGRSKLTAEQKEYIEGEDRRLGELVADTKKELEIVTREVQGRSKAVGKAMASRRR